MNSMFNFQDLSIQTIAQFFQAHPNSASLFVYLICFAEAMAVLGAFIPGTIAMPAIGFLIGLSLIPAGSTFMWAILGAATGDILSYLIGLYFQSRIHRVWPFTRWPGLLERSEAFFRKHGGKSVFIGRFIGPMRAMMPMIAGMFRMSIIRFLFAAITSAILWALSYLVPGALLGALSLELPAKVMAKYALWGFLVFLFLWGVIWVIQHFFRQILQMSDYYTMCFWRYLQKHEKWSSITKFLSDPRESDNHQQLTLVIIAGIFLLLFIWTLFQVINFGFLATVSHSLYHLLSSLRFTILDRIFVLITFLGDIPLLITVAGVIGLWLLWKRQWYVALHWLGVVGFSGIVVASLKFLINSSRPGDILYAIHVPSFPSAHSAMSLVIYGFLAVIIARELKEIYQRYLSYIIAGVMALIVSFSRIYLGAHWLVDILGGVFLGLIIVFLATVSYRRQHIVRLNVRKFILVVIGAFIIAWVIYGAFLFGKQMKKYTLIWPEQTIIFNDLIKEKNPKVPLYRLNRLGYPIEAFNVLYVGELAEIKQALLHHGWESQPTSLNVQNILKSFSKDSVISHLTIFPLLYHNKRAILLFTKLTGHDSEALILRLWASDINLKGSSMPLWIGTVEYHRTMPMRFSLKFLKKLHPFVGASGILAKDLKEKDFTLWSKHYPVSQQPPEMCDLHWDGKLLIIKANH